MGLGLGIGTLGALGAAFGHVGTFDVPANLRAGEAIETVTSAEIVDATPDGRTLVYTDSPARRLGFVDISRPSAPAPAGTLDVGGEPTSVATFGHRALVVVNTSPSHAAPSGDLVVVNTRRKAIERRIPLSGPSISRGWRTSRPRTPSPSTSTSTSAIRQSSACRRTTTSSWST